MRHRHSANMNDCALGRARRIACEVSQAMLDPRDARNHLP